MGMLNLFARLKSKPSETRSASGTGYTTALIAARAGYIRGVAGTAELTATVQAAVGLWESGLTLADVDGTDLIDGRPWLSRRALWPFGAKRCS